MNANEPITSYPMPTITRDSVTFRAAIAMFVLAAVLLSFYFFAHYGRITTALHGEDLVARCDQLSGMVGARLAGSGVEPGSIEWRRQKQTAFRACIDDYAAFSRLLTNP